MPKELTDGTRHQGRTDLSSRPRDKNSHSVKFRKRENGGCYTVTTILRDSACRSSSFPVSPIPNRNHTPRRKKWPGNRSRSRGCGDYCDVHFFIQSSLISLQPPNFQLAQRSLITPLTSYRKVSCEVSVSFYLHHRVKTETYVLGHLKEKMMWPGVSPLGVQVWVEVCYAQSRNVPTPPSLTSRVRRRSVFPS